MIAPSKVPGYSGIRGSQWCPLATTRASYVRVSPVSSVTSQVPSAFRRAFSTIVLNVMVSRRPNFST